MTALAGSDGTAVVPSTEEASAIYGRGFYGTLGSQGLSLDRYETSYLTEMDRLQVADGRGRALDWSEILRRATRAEAGFGVRYLVYRDLRQRGYVVRSSPPPTTFAVLPRGGTLHKTPARYWVEPYSEREPFDVSRLFELLARARAAKKTLLLALVDEESDLTYYRVRAPSPSGALAAPRLPAPVPGWLTEDRVLVFEPQSVEHLGKGLAYGSRVGGRLELSLLEAAYLIATGALELRSATSHRHVSERQLLSRARRLETGFSERLAAYRDLRSRRMVVKTGFKYGAHFRAYLRSPEGSHARYLIQAVPERHRSSWPTVAGSVRVAHAVRKDYLIAAVSPRDEVRFLSLERIRP